MLHEMVLKLSGIQSLGTLKVLCSDDAEVDFFNNIVHLQVTITGVSWVLVGVLCCSPKGLVSFLQIAE